jgi:ubiquinone/menaquinone biosynthesis C-methylase UbiE
MPGYILPHDLAGERQRLTLMSELLDPLERGHMERLGLRSGWRCLEVGCGNGSIAQWLAEQVAPSGHVVASDLDISYFAGVEKPCLEVRQLDILHGAIEEGAYDFVVARALLRHLTPAQQALQRMVAALKPGGVLLSIEPDMLPAIVAEPEALRNFWEGWLKWSVDAGIDYSIGRKIAPWLDSFGMEQVAAEGYTPLFNGGSPWAAYWIETVRELRSRLLESGHITDNNFAEFNAHYRDPHYWTSVLSMIASWGRKPV